MIIYIFMFPIILFLNYRKSKAVELPYISLRMLPRGVAFLILYDIIITVFSLSFIASIICSVTFSPFNDVLFSTIMVLIFNFLSIAFIIHKRKNAIIKFYL